MDLRRGKRVDLTGNWLLATDNWVWATDNCLRGLAGNWRLATDNCFRGRATWSCSRGCSGNRSGATPPHPSRPVYAPVGGTPSELITVRRDVPALYAEEGQPLRY